MSGEGGGGGSGGTWEPNCDNISFNTVIVSPQQHVISTLAVGDTLFVVLLENRLQLQTKQGVMVGTFNWTHLSKLVDCIGQGHQFVAVIRSIDGGHIRIHVTKGM